MLYLTLLLYFMFTYLFHGPSGCGKDTQIDLLATKLKFVKIGTGEMFRTTYEAGDPDGIKAHELWSVGKFVDSDLTYRMLDKWLSKYDPNENWIFVSVVRVADQIEMFDQLMNKYNRKLDAFVHFNLDRDTAIERMSMRRICPLCKSVYHTKYNPPIIEGVCDKDGIGLVQRDDDYPDKIINRLDEYNRTIEPILAEYSSRKILIEVDASPSIDDIQAEILQKINLFNK